MSKLYIFNTLCIEGAGGGQVYVHNKKEYLEEKGWTVLVIYSLKYEKAPNCPLIWGLKDYYKNAFPFLLKSPIRTFHFLVSIRVCKLLKKVKSISNGKEWDRIVIESTYVTASLWGELLAEKLKAKHIVYLLGERLNKQELASFFYYKLKRNELASIHIDSIKKMLEGQYDVNDLDCTFLAANCFSLLWPIDNKCYNLQDCIEADYTITYFGRDSKIPFSLIERINSFANNHSSFTFLFIICGYDGIKRSAIEKQVNLINSRREYSNITINYIPTELPVSKDLFRKSDVIIASAGCAVISFFEKCPTISLDVTTGEANGFFGVDTYASTFCSNGFEPPKLEKLLQEVLFEHKVTITDELVQKLNEYRHISASLQKFEAFMEETIAPEYFDPSTIHLTSKQKRSIFVYKCGLNVVIKRGRGILHSIVRRISKYIKINPFVKLNMY